MDTWMLIILFLLGLLGIIVSFTFVQSMFFPPIFARSIDQYDDIISLSLGNTVLTNNTEATAKSNGSTNDISLCIV